MQDLTLEAPTCVLLIKMSTFGFRTQALTTWIIGDKRVL